jgi:hypothetical protein
MSNIMTEQMMVMKKGLDKIRQRKKGITVQAKMMKAHSANKK